VLFLDFLLVFFLYVRCWRSFLVYDFSVCFLFGLLLLGCVLFWVFLVGGGGGGGVLGGGGGWLWGGVGVGGSALFVLKN